MNHEAESRINQELGFNERLFWADIPKQGFVLRASDAFTIPFSILWCGFTISWVSGIMESDASLFMIIWEIPFILIGLYLLLGRFIVDAIDRSKICYGITSERIIIIEEALGKTIKSYNMNVIGDLTLIEKSDGRGTIVFGRTDTIASFFGASTFPHAGEHYAPSFELIENANIVYEKIRKVQLNWVSINQEMPANH